MNSFKAPLFYIVSKSDLVYSQKNELSLLIDDLSEEKARELNETVERTVSLERVFCIAKFFGISELRFDDKITENSK